MKRLIYFGFVFIASIFLDGCYTDTISPEIEYAPQAVSFNNELAPLFKAKCTEVGCHIQGGHTPYLNDEKTSFKNILSGNYINTQFPKESTFYKYVFGEMAQYTTKDERQKIYDWIRNGATNN
ncbi:MAG: hypothetical protein IPL31_04265 [Saprospiraceae bacterium]|nr:hypothetical protein [Saprospiraceae bacterium]